MNQRPSGYEPDELPDCSTPQHPQLIDGGPACQGAPAPRAVANPAQTDSDHDGLGDTCDPCTDTDGDGFGNPGLPASVRTHLQRGQAGELPETPKATDPAFTRSQTVIIGSNRIALQAAREAAQARGYTTLILSSSVEGETRQIARMHAAIAREIRQSGEPVPPPACVIAGGETTVTIHGDGLGGRNQEFALAVALGIAGLDGVVMLSGGTDGTDGPTPAAGAFADGHTVARAQALDLAPDDFLRRNDAYHFFHALDDLLITGPTGTNVMDMHILLVG